jgi:hypothetical protein
MTRNAANGRNRTMSGLSSKDGLGAPGAGDEGAGSLLMVKG